MANRSSSPGFTLIELMVTLAVMAILLAASVPVFNMIEQRRVVGAAESALHQIQVARTEAIKQGRDIYFVSEGGAQWCHAISESPNCSCSEADSCTVRMAGTEDPVERTVRADQFSNITMPAGDLEIQFSHVRGTAISGAPADLEFSSPKGYGMELEINAIGRPSLCGKDSGRAGYRVCHEENP